MNAYKKEAVLTIGFSLAYVLMAHTAPWALILGIDNSVRVLGFPLHYFMAIVLGWFGVLAVSIVWNHYADKLEEEILAEEEDYGLTDDSEAHPETFGMAAQEGIAPLKEKTQ